MQTQRFDEWTAALVRGGSRRGVLRGLAGGVLGAFALDRSGALAKNDNAQGGGKPITSPAKPVCDAPTADCPLCYEARFGSDGPTGSQTGCCDPTRPEQEQYCGTKANQTSCEQPNSTYCGATLNSGRGSCVEASCTEASDKRPENGLRCAYTKKSNVCTTTGATFCCARFSSANFGHCVNSSTQC
jgi:hypothetical protein